MPLIIRNLKKTIEQCKTTLRKRIGDYKGIFKHIETQMIQEIKEIQSLEKTGSAVPEIHFSDIQKGKVSDNTITHIKKSGCVIIRNNLNQAEVEQRNIDLERYIYENGYFDTESTIQQDNYFDTLESDKPQIFGIYWSQTQMWARQHNQILEAKKFLNQLWLSENKDQKFFDPKRECLYADRVRNREPGDESLGLSPHLDTGSVERWLDTNYQKVYRHIFNGNWENYNAFDGAYRTDVQEVPSPAVCSVFRTFQGWLALTAQGPGDGTLQLIPSLTTTPYLLLRALQDDVPNDDLCGALPARALLISEKWHPLLLKGLVTIPKVYPGDTVWWHPDLIHAVEKIHSGQIKSNVIFMGSAPYCDKNKDYMLKQADAFIQGHSAPDFAPENHEINYRNRSKIHDLSSLGKKLMQLESI